MKHVTNRTWMPEDIQRLEDMVKTCPQLGLPWPFAEAQLASRSRQRSLVVRFLMRDI